MRGYTTKEKARITAGAVAVLVNTGWVVVRALAFLSARVKRRQPKLVASEIVD